MHAPHPVIAAAHSPSHEPAVLARSFATLLDHLNPPLPALIRRGERVLVKPFLHHGRHGSVANRLLSHPAFITVLIEALKDCGALIALGDAGSLKPGEQAPPEKQWLHDLAHKTGAQRVSFAASGACKVRGRLAFPRHYLIARAVWEADAVVSCANFSPHRLLGISGAVKNMFNAVIGKRQQQLHDLFPDPSALGRVIVDVCTAVKPRLSFLDMTTVRDPNGLDIQHPVGRVLAGCDPVALDAVAAHLIGWDARQLPTLLWGQRLGLGCADSSRISLSGLSWTALQAEAFPARPARAPRRHSLFDTLSRHINHALLPAKPVIDPARCSGCGECAALCPVGAIRPRAGGTWAIRARQCVNCQLCVAVCEHAAISLRFSGAARALRYLTGKPLTGSSS